jgi:starch phosphorylase
MDLNLDYQAEMLAAKIKHYLITMLGKTSDEANDEEYYRAFCLALREEAMINWLATQRTVEENKSRMLYYLSMEYMPGRFLSSAINNMCVEDLCRLVMQKMDRNYTEILTREPDPGLGNGGLGRLASCFLDSLATHHYPAQAYGLRYQYGIFEQQIWNNEQIEAPDGWLLSEHPWEFRRDARRTIVKYCGRVKSSKNIHGDEIYDLEDFEEVGALPFDYPIIGYSKDHDFSVVSLRLWTTKESPRNFQLQRYNAGRLDQASENMTLTDVLYPSDNNETGKRIRLKQEYLLVSASIQDIIRHYLKHYNNFRAFSDKVRIQINDTHPAMVIAELTRLLVRNYDLPWKTAVEITQECTGYTNHTVLREALEQWDYGLMQYLLPRQTKIIEKINLDFCELLRNKHPNDEDLVRRLSIIQGGHVRMANLAIVGSHSVNGVAELHSEILKSSVFKDFYELYPQKFTNVTNGVSQRRWLLDCNPDLSKFVTKLVGDSWVTDFNVIKKVFDYATDGEFLFDFLSIKKKNKLRFIEFINKDYKSHVREGGQHVPPLIDVDTLFDVQIKRFHEYKRQLMNCLHIIMLYNEILEDPDSKRMKRTFIFSGKAAAGYDAAKNTIHLIHLLARRINRDPAINNKIKIVFVENYNVSRAEIIIPAADLSEQISTAGMEASGTGNMKLSINGALTIGTDDGANIEMKESVTPEWWPFTFGCSAQEIAVLQKNGNYHPWDIVSKNQQIRKAVEMLRDRSFAENDKEHQVLYNLYQRLLEGYYGETPDRFFVIKDLESYYNTQKKVDELYAKPPKWAEYVFHNIAGMWKFSSDRSVKEYSEKIWGITPVPLNIDILERVRHEYSEHDKCRIY